METPKHLYKILSLRNWHATQNRKLLILTAEDNAFIHLATEEQLAKVMEKWGPGDAAILKLETKQMQGNLRLENGYYHLYDGFIPYEAIQGVDFRAEKPPVNKLSIVQVGDPVLRHTARKLSVEEILSPEIQALIEEMKHVMRAAPGVGLAAPQIGKDLQLVVVEDEDQSHLTAEQIIERQRFKVPFHVIINPQLFIENPAKAEFFEGCLSVPHFLGIVPRAKEVRVECLNERAEPVVIRASGWYARILQHEIDHLNATLYIDRALLPTLMTEENFIKQWKGKTIQEVKEQLL